MYSIMVGPQIPTGACRTLLARRKSCGIQSDSAGFPSLGVVGVARTLTSWPVQRGVRGRLGRLVFVGVGDMRVG